MNPKPITVGIVMALGLSLMNSMAGAAVGALPAGSAPDGATGAPAASPTPSPLRANAEPPPGCAPESVAAATRDLFPPAPEPARAASATILGTCRPPGSDALLAAALNLSSGADTQWYIVRALASFQSPVAIATLRTLAAPQREVQRDFSVRALALPALIAFGLSDDVVAVLANVREDDRLRFEALRALNGGGRAPDRRYLLWLRSHAGPQLGRFVRELLAHDSAAPAKVEGSTPEATKPEATKPEGNAATGAPAAAAPTAPQHQADARGAKPTENGQAIPGLPVVPAPAGASPSPAPATPPAPAKPAGPSDGTAVAIGSSTVAGAALMLNLSLLGVQDVTPQLLLGSAGAVIGFGTSWALSRFGVRPTLEQASWFANVTAWGTLAGITIYGGSGADSYKLRYGSLVLGEITGMAAGVWSARRWTWTGPQIVMSDSLFLGTAMAAFGVNRLLYETPRVTAAAAIGVLPAMVASAVAGHVLTPSSNDVALMATSAVAGAWLGGLASSGLAREELASRWGQGGLLIGGGLGYLGGAAAGAFSEVQPLRLKVGVGSIAAGNLLGLGLHMMATGIQRADAGQLSDGDRNRWKLGSSVGGFLLGAAGFAAAPHLDPGPQALPMTLWGGLYGAGTMWLASAASYHGQELNETDDAILYGGMLAAGVAGSATGLALSNWFAPDPTQQWTAFGATAATVSVGWGMASLSTDGAGTADAVGVVGGVAVGLTGSALLGQRLRLGAPAYAGALEGLAYGAVIGALMPSLSEPDWTGGRHSRGGAMIGAGGGALLGATLGQWSGASAREVTIAGLGTALGFTAGLGAGRMWPSDDSRPERIGVVTGMTTLAAASVLLMRPLRLTEPLPEGSGSLVVTAAAHGIFNGIWSAALVDPSGSAADVPVDRMQGAILFGGSLGIAVGVALAPRLHLGDGAVMLSAATAAGSLIGRGTALVLAEQPGRADAAATLAGSLVGTTAGALALRAIDPDSVDGQAGAVGLGYGALLGALIPSLGQQDWPGWGRRTSGGLMAGTGAGAIAGVALRRGFHGEQRDVGLTMAAGLDGGATGIGWALLLGGDTGSEHGGTQAVRIGTTVGVAAGLGLGMANWSRLTLGSGDAMMITAATALTGMNATLIPTLGHATTAEWNQRRMAGGFLAGAGTASFGAALVAPFVEVDGDLVGNALAMDGVFAGAGAGVGALINERADAPIAGALIGGASGLLLGGVLHKRIELDARSGPIMGLGAVQGLWMGAWLPYVLREPGAVTDDQRAGGVAAGTFGGLGLAVLANTLYAPAGGDVAFAALSSGIGAGIGGGIALLSEGLHDQGAVGLMLGGTAGGLVVGGLLAPRLSIDTRVAGTAAIGGVLGASEALLFTWSSRSDRSDAYLGAGLLGAGVGTGLGLANGLVMGDDSNGRLPALAGFTAWGAWMGSLSGSLVARDAHEITAGGVIGSNLGLLGGYGLLRSGVIETRDFGWLSLFGAMGTAAGAGIGAPFASRGQPTPILAGLAVGPAVGMTVGAMVLPRLRAATGAASPAVALRQAVSGVFRRRTVELAGGVAAPAGAASTKTAPELSSTVTRDLQTRHRLRRNIARAIDASIQISDCAPLLGALPTPDAGTGKTSTPMMLGLIGHWQ